MKLRDAISVMMKFTGDLSGITLLSFSLRPLCQTVSYAAERSMKTAPHLSFRSNPASISSVSKVTWSVVQLPSRNFDLQFANTDIFKARYSIDASDPHFLGITEYWANKDITDAELGLEGFVMFWKYRMGRRGGEYYYTSNILYQHTKYNYGRKQIAKKP